MADVIDLREARERALNNVRTNNPILDALDALGLALVEHGHQWTDRERLLYETAAAYAKGMTNA